MRAIRPHTMMQGVLLALLLAFFLLPVIHAHEGETEEMSGDTACSADGTCPEASDIAGRSLSTLVQMPTFSLKMEYAAQQFILPFFSWIVGGAVALAVLISIMRRAKPLTSHAFVWAAIGILLVLTYSVSYYYASGEESGINFCADGQCFKAMHIHTKIFASICGQDIDFTKEAGNLGKQHTHKEPNLIHLHDKVPLDPVTGEMTNTTALELGGFFDQVKIRFNNTCLDGKCNGDACADGHAGKLSMKANGNESIAFEHYVWSDGDTIELTFG